MKKLIFRLVILMLSVYLAGTIISLYASEHHAPAPSTPTPPPVVAPPPSAPPQIDAKVGIPQGGIPVPSRGGGGGGWCGGGGGLAPSDPEGDRIRQQVADLRGKAATYKQYAQQYENSAARMRDRFNEAKRGRPFTPEDTKWMDDHTTSDVGGKRGKSYDNAPQFIKNDIDDYEVWSKKHNISYGLIQGTMTTWATAKKIVGYQTKDETLQESYRIKWAVEVARATDIARSFREKAQQLETEADKLEAQLQKR